MKFGWILTLFLCGCETPQMTLVNNTPYALTVKASNVVIANGLRPGESVAVPPPKPCWPAPFDTRVPVAVSAYDYAGCYIGANDWTFYSGQAQVWRVDRINIPQP